MRSEIEGLAGDEFAAILCHNGQVLCGIGRDGSNRRAHLLFRSETHSEYVARRIFQYRTRNSMRVEFAAVRKQHNAVILFRICFGYQ
jgi:hypothetical protein